MPLELNSTDLVPVKSPYMPEIHYGINHEIVWQKEEEVKMLVILDNGEQRLITFPSSCHPPCTLRELLNQLYIEVQAEDKVECIENFGSGIDYIVKIGNYQTLDTTKIIKNAKNYIQQQVAQQKLTQQPNL